MDRRNYSSDDRIYVTNNIIKLSKREMAAHLNVSVDALRRQIQRWKQKGVKFIGELAEEPVAHPIGTKKIFLSKGKKREYVKTADGWKYHATVKEEAENTRLEINVHDLVTIISNILSVSPQDVTKKTGRSKYEIGLAKQIICYFALTNTTVRVNDIVTTLKYSGHPAVFYGVNRITELLCVDDHLSNKLLEIKHVVGYHCRMFRHSSV